MVHRQDPLRLGIDWDAEPEGPFPHFTGTLSAIEDDHERCSLRLAGTYRAPFGVAGSAFDSAIGNRIARDTARDLLGRLRTAAEADYRARFTP